VTVKQILKFERWAEKHKMEVIFNEYFLPQDTHLWLEKMIKKTCCKKCRDKIFKVTP